LFFAMPWNLFGGFGADHRLLPAMGLLLAGSLTWRTARDDRGRGSATTGSQLRDRTRDDTSLAARNSFQTESRHREIERPGRAGPDGGLLQGRAGFWERLAFGLIVALLVVRIVAVTVEWRGADREYAEFLLAFASLTDGSKVYYGFGHAGAHKHGNRPKYFVPCLAVASKQVYLPYLFTSDSNPGINMKYTPDYEPLQYLSPGPRLTYGQSPNWSAILDKFDYFLLGDEQFFNTPVPRQLTPVYKGNTFTLYKNSATGTKATDSRAGG